MAQKRITFTEDLLDKPHDLEMTAERMVQVDGIMRLVNESIEKLKISLIMPRILENPITLGQYLAGTKYEKYGKIVKEYLREKKLDPAKNDPEENYHLLKLIDMFHENYEMLNVLPNWLDDLSPEDKSLLSAFKLLQSIAEQRLNRSAMSELNKEKQIHQIYHDNEQMKKNILEFQNKLHNQKINLRWKLAAKDGVIKKYEEDLAFKKWDNNVRIREELVKASLRIHNTHAASMSKQKELEEELEKTKANYERILKQNLVHEKEVRDEKNKLLLQLQALVKKFDQNIGEKIKENVYLQEEYDEQKRQFEEFLLEYQREENEYETVVKAKEEEDRRRHKEKVLIFMLTRAAKIIQRAWRAYRKAKKKTEKKKGKKRK